MTHDERLMLTAQGAADPELAGCDVHRPVAVSAAEAMRESAAKIAEWAHMMPPDGGSPTDGECRVAEFAAHLIRALPLPADPRDAEIAAYRSALTEITQQKLCDELTRAEYDHADFEGAYDAIIKVARAALAQSGGAK